MLASKAWKVHNGVSYAKVGVPVTFTPSSTSVREIMDSFGGRRYTLLSISILTEFILCFI